jgi:purine nucleosidase
MKKILLFADPGIDDSLAIIYALLSPEIELLGIVASYGNVTKQQATENAAYLLKLAGREDIPVIEGATFPLSGEVSVYYPEIHGEEGLGPIRPPMGLKLVVRDFSYIFDIIKQNKDITIVDTGRTTSLSNAFNLKLELMKEIKEIYLMGGAFFVPGNVTPLAEANFYGDPIAVNVVLDYANEVYITPLNVTNRAIVTREIANYIYSIASNPFKELIPSITNYYADAYAKLRPGGRGASIHDVFTLYYMLNKDKIYSVTKDVEVSVLETARGLSYADFRTNQMQPGARHTIALNFQYQDFLADFIKVMSSPLR